MLKTLNINPSKIICLGLNYKDHAQELNMPIPDEPIIFLKPPTALIESGQNIVYPAGVKRLDYEAELAVVIEKKAKNIKPQEVPEFIKGYTCVNDVTARDLQQKDGQWTRAKSFDAFCPVGPRIAKDVDPGNLDIELKLNGQTKQKSNTKNFIFPINFITSFISQIMTLLPGDIIATGTPAGVGPMKAGDRVEVSIKGIGNLINYVVKC